jgi:hypothetical protein
MLSRPSRSSRDLAAVAQREKADGNSNTNATQKIGGEKGP